MYLGSELATSHLSPAPWQFNVSRDSNTRSPELRPSSDYGHGDCENYHNRVFALVCMRESIRAFQTNKLISVFCKQTFLNMKNR